ncbi:SET domain-containing protein [Apiospora aurea]|uniref:SET domain-containing protein n=1 Tax=Apiospora aurea TaxID=335848 RepID=A0ABR1QT16_9PEZI
MPQLFDGVHFPSLRELPHGDGDPDCPYYDSITGKNRIHWCLLGQITEVHQPKRRVFAKDCEGERFEARFYPKYKHNNFDDDDSRLLEYFNVGNTLAMYYARNHQPGNIFHQYRITEALIIPLPMDKLLQMNNDYVEYADAYGTKRKCHGCGVCKEKEDLWMCGGCKIFYYCH